MGWSLSLFAILLVCHFIFYPLASNPASLALFGNATQWIGLFFGMIWMAKIARTAPKKDFSKWMYLTIGVAILLLGQTFLSYSELLLKKSAYGSISDAFWIIGFCLLLVGLFQLARSAASPKEFVQGHIFGLVLFALVFSILWHDIHNPVRPTYLKILDVFYSILEVWMVVLALILRQFTQQKLAWTLATISLTVYLMTDTFVVFYSDLHTPIYRYLDIPYFIGICAWWLLGSTLKSSISDSGSVRIA